MTSEGLASNLKSVSSKVGGQVLLSAVDIKTDKEMRASVELRFAVALFEGEGVNCKS